MNQNKIITISRQYGSGGRIVAQKLAEALEIPFY
ncbi:MAG: cytidylate kinase family protein, partial [Anaerotignum sp.]|nr:cytidylate kinase family protein [Anaerotignum sp.]